MRVGGFEKCTTDRVKFLDKSTSFAVEWLGTQVQQLYHKIFTHPHITDDVSVLFPQPLMFRSLLLHPFTQLHPGKVGFVAWSRLAWARHPAQQVSTSWRKNPVQSQRTEYLTKTNENLGVARGTLGTRAPPKREEKLGLNLKE